MPETSEPLQVPAWLYQHFDADYRLDVPEQGFGGWKKVLVELAPARTAVVVMHAWDCGTREEYPGWHRVVPYIPRATEICVEVFPPLLQVVRSSPLALFHVVSAGQYYKDLPGHKRAAELAGPTPAPPERIASDSYLDKLRAFKREHGYPGLHNELDIRRGFERLDFAPEARPLDNEGVAEDGRQLFALCKERGVNHLIYCGFAINWCLLLSPGGMHDMERYGFMCSALRQATVAVENKETARTQLCKEIGLWRVALAFGYVFDVHDFVRALHQYSSGG